MSERFHQRFEYFSRAFLNLESICDIKNFNALEKEGIIQRFEILFELSWKVMKDFLNEQGFVAKSPKDTIREAFGYGLIDDGNAWIRALNRQTLQAIPIQIANLMRMWSL